MSQQKDPSFGNKTLNQYMQSQRQDDPEKIDCALQKHEPPKLSITVHNRQLSTLSNKPRSEAGLLKNQGERSSMNMRLVEALYNSGRRTQTSQRQRDLRNLFKTVASTGGSPAKKDTGLMLASRGDGFIVLKNGSQASPPPRAVTQQLQKAMQPQKIRDLIYGNEKKVVSTAGTLRTTVATLQRHMARLRSPLRRESDLQHVVAGQTIASPKK